MKVYTIKRIGVHDGYYKDRDLRKELVGHTVIPLIRTRDGAYMMPTGNPKEKPDVHLRDEDETKDMGKGRPVQVLAVSGSYYGNFAIPDMEVEQTKFYEVFLTIKDTETGVVIDEDVEPDEMTSILQQIKALTKRVEALSGSADLPDVPLKPFKKDPVAKTRTVVGEATTFVQKGSDGTLIVEDDSAMPKNAPESGFYEVGGDGEPDPANPAEGEPPFAPVSNEAKQEKFDHAEAIAAEKKAKVVAPVKAKAVHKKR